ncbi:hypothetical protein ABE073_04555 [Lederbergia citrisecunda]|uniref:hypothetical protein n=1 Tax=Lederbergia citrisecunda TaxID=2833583 RepID=UPI003D29D505
MKEYNVKTDEDFFDNIHSLKVNAHHIASLFQNEGAITNEEEIQDWLRYVNNTIAKLERIKTEGCSRFELR